jgi:hypothetical protein
VPTVSQARTGRKAADGDHCCDRARAGGLHLGNRQTGTAHGELNESRSISETVSRRVSPRNNTSNAGQGWRHGHGQENPRRYYQPDLIRRWTLDRGSSATYHRSGGNQPAYQSMINRRFMIVPPALPSSGQAEQLEQTSKHFPCLLLEVANMRVPRIIRPRNTASAASGGRRSWSRRMVWHLRCNAQ